MSEFTFCVATDDDERISLGSMREEHAALRGSEADGRWLVVGVIFVVLWCGQ